MSGATTTVRRAEPRPVPDVRDRKMHKARAVLDSRAFSACRAPPFRNSTHACPICSRVARCCRFFVAPVCHGPLVCAKVGNVVSFAADGGGSSWRCTPAILDAETGVTRRARWCAVSHWHCGLYCGGLSSGCLCIVLGLVLLVLSFVVFSRATRRAGPSLMSLSMCCPEASTTGTGCESRFVGQPDCLSLVGTGGVSVNDTSYRQVFSFAEADLPLRRPYTPVLLCPRDALCALTFSVVQGTQSVGEPVELVTVEGPGVGTSPVGDLLGDVDSVVGDETPACADWWVNGVITDRTYTGYFFHHKSIKIGQRGTELATADPLEGLITVTVSESRMLDRSDGSVLLANGRPLRPPIFALKSQVVQVWGIVGALILVVVSIALMCVFCARIIAGPDKLGDPAQAAAARGAPPTRA